MICTDKYELEYDSAKKRIFWKVKGLWSSVADVPNFDSDWKQLCKGIPKGFTVFADLTEMQPFPQDVAKRNEAKQRELMAMGCARVACYVNSQIVTLQVKRVSKASGMSGVIRAFDSQKEAENWLDSSPEVTHK